jgi:hypothetical protein
MSTLLKTLKSLLPSIESQNERDDAYLGASVDIYDLERRMREIEERGRHRAYCHSLSLFGR